MKSGFRLLLPILAILCLLNACRSSPPTAGPASAIRPSPTTVAIAPPVPQPVAPTAATLRQRIRQELAADSFPAALELILTSGLPEAEWAEEYGQALRGVLSQAAVLVQKDLPEKAGPLYRTAQESYPKAPAIAARLETSPTEIEARVDACANRLMERGLEAYRSGDLESAIRTWKLIHGFSPRHQASRKALQTAEVQLANLKKVRAEQ